MNADTGVIYVTQYDGNGRGTGQLVKQGADGTAYYLSATDYGDGVEDNKPTAPAGGGVYLPGDGA